MFMRRHYSLTFGASPALFAAVVSCLFTLLPTSALAVLPSETTVIETNFLALEVSKFDVYEETLVIGVDYDTDQIFAAARDGNTISKFIFDDGVLALEKTNTVEKDQTAYKRKPILDKFTSLFSSSSTGDEEKITHKTYILDLHVGAESLYVSTVFYFEDPKECSFVAIYEFNLDLIFSRQLFRSSPCVGGVGAYSEIAGRLASNDDKVFITGGNIFLDLYRNRYPRADLCCFDLSYPEILDTTNLFGSVVEIDKKTLVDRKISKGHRSPQGLVFDRSRSVLFETEHGPRGGDELNVIEEGKHYGWPWVSLGRVYKNKHAKKKFDSFPANELSPSPKYNSHDGYELPLFSWTPSIGISQIAILPSDCSFCEFWANDLLVSSLKDRSINRLKLEGNERVIYSERIYVGERIRDIEISKQRVFLATDDGNILALKPIDPSTEGPFPPVEKKLPVQTNTNAGN